MKIFRSQARLSVTLSRRPICKSVRNKQRPIISNAHWLCCIKMKSKVLGLSVKFFDIHVHYFFFRLKQNSNQPRRKQIWNCEVNHNIERLFIENVNVHLISTYCDKAFLKHTHAAFRPLGKPARKNCAKRRRVTTQESLFICWHLFAGVKT